MQFTYRLLAIIGGVLILMQAPADAQWLRGQTSNTSRRSTPSATRRPQKAQVPQARQIGNDEQQVMSRVRGYQSQLQREQQLLEQRLKQADQLRRRGLQSKDQRVLDQAERYERQAMAAYEQRIKQFEGRELGNMGTKSSARTPAPGRSYAPQRKVTPKQQQARPQRATRRTKSRKSSWDWLRGWR